MDIPLSGQNDPPAGELEALLTRTQIQDRYRIKNLTWFDWLVEQVPVHRFTSILDVGCGPALYWTKMSPLALTNRCVVLGDPSAQMLRYAHHQLCSLNSSDFIQFAGDRIPFCRHQFDLILALGVLDLVPDIHRVLSEFTRALKPQGYLCISAGGSGHLQELEALAIDLAPAQDLGGKPERFGLENGSRLISPCFRTVDLLEYKTSLVFREVKPIWDYLLSEKSFQQTLTVPKRTELRRRISDQLERDGEIKATVHKGLIIAQKND